MIRIRISNGLQLTDKYFYYRFNKDVKGFLCLANQGGKYLPYIRTSVSISKELEMFQQSIFQLASSKLEALRTKKAETSNRLKDLHDRMEVLTVELNLEIKNLLNGIEIIVRSVYQDEIENIAVLVSGFEAPFYNDPAVLNLYKQHLVRCVCIEIRITCIPKYKEILLSYVN